MRYAKGTNEERKAEAQESRPGKSHRVKRAHTDLEEQPTPYVRHYGHHRIALKEVCLPITAFRSSRQLASIIGDAIEGVWVASPSRESCVDP